MTGAVTPEAIAAMQAGASPGVEVLVVGASEVAAIDGAIDVLLVGAATRYRVALDLLQRWPGRVVPGGLLFVCGAFSEPQLTAALLRTVGRSRAWRYFGREGDLAEYVRADLAHGEQVLDTIAQLAQVPLLGRTLARRRAARSP